MLSIDRKEECCGCTACASACPVKCVSMKSDKEGFLYPSFNKEKCIECKKCEKVCPIKNNHNNTKEVDAICARSASIGIVKDSTSGGFFTPLAQHVLEQNGKVIGAAYTENKKIEHITVVNEKDLSKLRGSKYVQSDLKYIFSEVKKELEAGVMMCFSGTPCQISGLLNYLEKDYENLITVDVVCHGTPSPKLWKKYVDYQEEKYKSNIKSVSFRKKTYGYHSGTMELVFENGKKYKGSARVDYMLKSFFREISSRPSCYECSFKTDTHQSDFTIFDAWHASELVPGLKDDDLGYTNVLINTDKGRDIFSIVKDKYEYYPIEKERAIELDGKMVRNSAVPHPKRNDYYLDLDNEGLDEHIQKFIPISKKDYLVEKSKTFLYKTKLLYLLKRIKKGSVK
ncbi:MAG: Coenzyme F420 hydrogenase/dehydrogenase, beta subunit C-terminal domain [Eubacterium sp.]|nr:Coenzyme F420 hydrogenase/dehydrogenase, beta subunit C-terminal domain [Eubacterium sp.]